jgi:hypothetical protein
LIDTAEQASVLGVAFTPGGAAPFLHMPAREVRDLLVSLEDVWGAEAHGLRERLLEAAPDDASRFWKAGCCSRLAAISPSTRRYPRSHRVRRRPTHIAFQRSLITSASAPGVSYLDDVDAAYERALGSGGESLREPQDQFYGDRSAGIKDRFGNQWWLATHVEEVSMEEMQRRQAAMAQA